MIAAPGRLQAPGRGLDRGPAEGRHERGCRASDRLGVWLPEDWGDTCCDPVLVPPSDENGVLGAVMERIGRCDRGLEG